MLNARRKRRTEATTTTTTTTTTTKKTKVRSSAKTKTQPIEGSLRSLAIGRAYTEFEAVLDDDGKVDVGFYFDPKGRYAEAVTKGTRRDRVLSNKAFIQHINKTVVEKIFGMPMQEKVVRMLIEGIADQVIRFVEDGRKVKYPNLATFTRKECAPRRARNPRTGEEVQVPARVTMRAAVSRAAKAYMDQSAV